MLVKEGIFADQAIVKIQNSCIHIVCFCKRANSLTSVSLKVKYDDGFCFFLGCTRDMKVRRPGIKRMPQHWPWSLRWLVGSLTYCATRKLLKSLVFLKSIVCKLSSDDKSCCHHPSLLSAIQDFFLPLGQYWWKWLVSYSVLEINVNQQRLVLYPWAKSWLLN